MFNNFFVAINIHLFIYLFIYLCLYYDEKENKDLIWFDLICNSVGGGEGEKNMQEVWEPSIGHGVLVSRYT